MSSYGTVITTTQAINDVQSNTNINATTQALILSSVPPGQTLTATGALSNAGGFVSPLTANQGLFVTLAGGGTVQIGGTGGFSPSTITGFSPNIIVQNGTTLLGDFRFSPNAASSDESSSAREATSDQGLVVVGADGNDTILTGSGADNITGAQGNDSIATYLGNDTIVTGVGIDTVDAGIGFDVAQVAGTAGNWTAAKTATEVVLVSDLNSANVSHLKNVNFISFTGATGGQTSIVISGTEAEGNAMRLYQGLFNRSADQSGAEYWEAQVRAGASTDAIANQFLVSNEYTAAHPSQTNTQFVEMLYVNALGRAADVGGLNYWVGELNQGASKAAVAVGIIDSQEGATNIDNVIVLIGTV